MHLQRVANLLFDGVQWIERCHRFLEDHRHRVATNASEPGWLCTHEIFTVQQDLPAIGAAKADDQTHQCRFTRPGLPDHGHGLTGGHVGCAAHDLQGRRSTYIHHTHAQFVCVGVWLGALNQGYYHAREGRRNGHGVFDLEPSHRQPMRQFLRRNRGVDECAQPRLRKLHSGPYRSKKLIVELT